MPIDPRIALGVNPFQVRMPDPNAKMNALAGVMQLQQADSANRLNALKIQEAERGVQEGNALAGVIRRPDFDWSNPEHRKSAFGAAPAKALDLYKGHVEVQDKVGAGKKREFEMARDRYGIFQKALGAHVANPQATKQTVLTTLQGLVQSQIMDGNLASNLASTLPDDPQQLRAFLQNALSTQMEPAQILKAFAPTPTQVDNGQQIGFRDTNPNSPTYGQTTAGAPVQKVMTPGEVATDARGREQLQISRGQLGVSQSQLGVAQQNLGLSRDRLQLERDRERREAGADQGSGGPVLGVPTPTVLPWANQTTPKDANKVKAQEISRGSKEIEKDADAAVKLQSTARDAQRFLELNKKLPTGGLMDRMALTRWAQGMGQEYSEMESITARLAPAMREPGSGSTSDFDGKQFERATVGVDKPKKANENIAKAVVARAQQAQEYAEFRQTYLEQNGTLQGADRYWKEYANANPIFDPAKPGAFELNERRRAWGEHFKSKTATKPAAAPAAGGLSQAELQELQELRKKLGRP